MRDGSVESSYQTFLSFGTRGRQGRERARVQVYLLYLVFPDNRKIMILWRGRMWKPETPLNKVTLSLGNGYTTSAATDVAAA